jgi:hypothetical protein
MGRMAAVFLVFCVVILVQFVRKYGQGGAPRRRLSERDRRPDLVRHCFRVELKGSTLSAMT